MLDEKYKTMGRSDTAIGRNADLVMAVKELKKEKMPLYLLIIIRNPKYRILPIIRAIVWLWRSGLPRRMRM
jgi:hypothetical protein